MKYGKLKKSWQFRKIYREGGKYLDNLFILYVLPNNTQETRIGLTVTKKVGMSVQRNRIKRVIREVFRSLSEIAPGNDLVVIARRASVNVKYSQVQDSLTNLLHRAHILKSRRNQG
jgi:ribonuclease P protein component